MRLLHLLYAMPLRTRAHIERASERKCGADSDDHDLHLPFGFTGTPEHSHTYILIPMHLETTLMELFRSLAEYGLMVGAIVFGQRTVQLLAGLLFLDQRSHDTMRSSSMTCDGNGTTDGSKHDICSELPVVSLEQKEKRMKEIRRRRQRKSSQHSSDGLLVPKPTSHKTKRNCRHPTAPTSQQNDKSTLGRCVEEQDQDQDPYNSSDEEIQLVSSSSSTNSSYHDTIMLRHATDISQDVRRKLLRQSHCYGSKERFVSH